MNSGILRNNVIKLLFIVLVLIGGSQFGFSKGNKTNKRNLEQRVEKAQKN